jgi:hypothetical protein
MSTCDQGETVRQPRLQAIRVHLRPRPEVISVSLSRARRIRFRIVPHHREVRTRQAVRISSGAPTHTALLPLICSRNAHRRQMDPRKACSYHFQRGRFNRDAIRTCCLRAMLGLASYPGHTAGRILLLNQGGLTWIHALAELGGAERDSTRRNGPAIGRTGLGQRYVG